VILTHTVGPCSRKLCALRVMFAFVQSNGPVDPSCCRCRDNSIMHVRLLVLQCPQSSSDPSIAITGALITGTYALAKRRGRVVASIYAASAALNCGIAGATFFSTLIKYVFSPPSFTSCRYSGICHCAPPGPNTPIEAR
jgi:hypothetical protein